MASIDDWSVEEWLERVGLPQYTEDFLDNGYDAFELCAALKPEELDAIGVVDPTHRAELFVQAEKLQKAGGKSSNDNSGTKQQPPSAQLSPMNAPPPPSYTEPWSSYSEPWSSDAPVKQNGVALQVDGVKEHGVVHRPAASEKLVPKKPKFAPAAPAVSVHGGTGGSGGGSLTRLQLKLKIRQELQQDGVVLSDHQFYKQDGSANENMLAGLAEDYAGRFRLESLGVYDALLDIWKHVTRVDPLTSPPTAAATAAAAVVEEPDAGLQKSGSSMLSQDNNYDEPFDSANPLSQVLQQRQSPGVQQGSPSPSKSHTLPPSGSKDYDEPFDTMTPGASPPPKKISVTKPDSNTLPSPVTRRAAAGPPEKAKKKDKKKSVEEARRSPKTSPKAGFKLFGKKDKKDRKDKKRTQSSLDLDDRQQCPNLTPPPLPSSKPPPKKKFWGKSKDDSAVSKVSSSSEEVDVGSRKSSRASMGVFTFSNGDAIPPPLPPRRYAGAGSDSNSTSGSETSSPHPPNKLWNHKTAPLESWNKDAHSSNGSLSDRHRETDLGRLQTNVLSGSDAELHRRSQLGGDDDDDPRGLRTSKSYDNLAFNDALLSKEKKKQQKQGIISRLFKRKTLKEMSPSRLTFRKKTTKVESNRSSVASEVVKGSTLTSSMSLPEILGIKIPQGDNGAAGRHTGMAYSQTPPKGSPVGGFDAIKPEDISRGRENVKHSPNPPRLNKTSLSTSPEDPDASPLLRHKIFIRGSSDSSATDHVIIPIQSGGGGGASESSTNSRTTGGINIQDLHSPEPDHKYSDSDDSQNCVFEAHPKILSDFKKVEGESVQQLQKTNTPADSLLDGELTSSLTKKPPPPPKPRSLSKGSSPPTFRGSTLPVAGTPQATPSPDREDKAQTLPVAKARSTPPKPVRQRSTVELKDESSTLPPKPVPRRSVIEQGSSSSSSTPNKNSDVPPPKPATLRRRKKKSATPVGGEEEEEAERPRGDGENSTLTPSTAINPSSTNAPPPKPVRAKYKSVKLMDPSSRPSPPPAPAAKSRTLPSGNSSSRERSDSKRSLSTGGIFSGKPKPLPKPKPRSLSKSSPPNSKKSALSSS